MHDRLVVFNLLQSMPKSFQQLVTVLETLLAKQCTLDFVKARLLSKNVKRRNNFEKESTLDGELAFFGKPFKINSFSCGKVDHKRSSCPMKSTDQRNLSGRPKKGKAT